MKLSKYFKLKNQLEIQPFQSSFNTLKEVLYYFSFLGNIFLILFGFFFIKNVTDSIPLLFPNVLDCMGQLEYNNICHPVLACIAFQPESLDC